MKAKAYCIVYGCLNNNKNKSLTFFTLPKDKERRQKWLTVISREDLLQKEDMKRSSYLVCSDHFEDSAVKIIKHLKDDAIPTLRLHNQPEDEGSSCSDTETTSGRDKREETCSATELIPVPMKGKGKGSKIQYVTIGTQTESFTSMEEQTQVQTFNAKKRKLSNETEEFELKQETEDWDLQAKYQSITYVQPEDDIGRRLQKLIDWRNKFKDDDTETETFALYLHYSSPLAYKCLKTVLKLPSEKALKKFKINIPPKFDDQVLEGLALKINSFPDTAKHCTICVGEMTLKRNLHYNILSDEVIGFQNINGTISPEIASNAFVIMLQGNYFTWKQPLGYALLATAEHYEEVDIWLREVIAKLSTIGIKVKAIVSDQGSNFDKFAKEVKKVSEEKPYFVYGNTKIYYIINVPDLMKCIRNNLLISDFIHDDKKISWDYIEQLYKEQKEKKLKLIPKITEAHIKPKRSERMVTELAVQTLSRTVSTALNTYIDIGKISEEARPTANFLELMNDLFDVLNSSKIICDNEFQAAFKLSKGQENVLNNAKEMFATIKAVNRNKGENDTEHIKSLGDFLISIEAIKMLLEDVKTDGFKYLLTRRLNRDNLENFFDEIRQQRGFYSDPTPVEFRRAFSKLFLSNMLKSSPNQNCEIDIYDVILEAEDIVTKVQLFGTDSSPKTCPVSLGGETDYRMELPDENALTYASSYLFFKCVKKHKCLDINRILGTLPDLSETLLDNYEALNKNSGFYGKLKMPPKEFIQYVQNLETAFVQNFYSLMIENNPGGELLKLFKNVRQQTPCTCFPVNYLLKLFARLRIYVTIKLNNRQFKDEIQKYVKVSHL